MHCKLHLMQLCLRPAVAGAEYRDEGDDVRAKYNGKHRGLTSVTGTLDAG